MVQSISAAGLVGGPAIRNANAIVGEIIGAIFAIALTLAFAFAAPAHAKTNLPVHFPHLNFQPYTPPQPHHTGAPNSQYARAATNHDLDRERVTYFISDVTVARDGSLTVHETIRLIAEDETIRVGILRDIPIVHFDDANVRRRIRPNIVSVTLDNRDTPYTLEMQSHVWEIGLIDHDNDLKRGPHTYEIVYRTNRQVGFFDSYDELTWNGTPDWAYDIDQAVIAFHFPTGAHVDRFGVRTGAPNLDDGHFIVEHPSENEIIFRSTVGLASGETMSAMAKIAKGAIDEPEGVDAISAFVHDDRDVAAVLIGLIFLTAYYYIVWIQIGRDTRTVVAPLYTPPRNLSPAAMRYILNMGYDRKAFAATLISLAVKGYLRVDDEPGFLQHTFTLVRLNSRAPLSPLEASVLETLFAFQREIPLTQANQPRIANAIAILKKCLRDEGAGYFVTNRAWWRHGLWFVALSTLVAAWFSGPLEDTFMIFLMSSFFGWFACQLGMRAIRHWTAVFARAGSRMPEFFRAIWWSIMTLPPLGMIFGFMFLMSDGVAPETVFALVAQGFVAYFFFHLLKAPTAEGAKLIAEIKGFRMFLMMTEKEQLKLAHPAGLTTKTFETYLPYAVALDAENGWTRRFESDVTLAATMKFEGGQRYAPVWYSSSAASGDGFADFTDTLGHALTGATFGADLRAHFAGGFVSDDRDNAT